MEYGLYCIRDLKSGFLAPTVDISDAVAIRNFRHATLNTDSLFFTSPADYRLIRIGSFDTETGVIKDEIPELLAEASDFVKEEFYERKDS